MSFGQKQTNLPLVTIVTDAIKYSQVQIQYTTTIPLSVTDKKNTWYEGGNIMEYKPEDSKYWMGIANNI